MGVCTALVVAVLAATVPTAAWSMDEPAEPAARPTALPALTSASMAELLERRATPQTGWLLSRSAEYPGVLVLQFPGLGEQGAAMNRIAALFQKTSAPRARVLSQVELNALIRRAGDNAQTFFKGHDYTLAQIAQFFALAAAQGAALNSQEQALLELLRQQGLLSDLAGDAGDASADAQAAAGRPTALVTFTNTQPDDPATPQNEAIDDLRRYAVLVHEISHGRFHSDADYRAHCWAAWRDLLTETERRAVRSALARAGYDSSNETLVVNEAQALLFHTPDPRAFRPSAFGMSSERHAALRRAFQAMLLKAQRPA